MNEYDDVVIDRSSTCLDWYRLWTSLGFNEHQWISRIDKIEEYTRVESTCHRLLLNSTGHMARFRSFRNYLTRRSLPTTNKSLNDVNY
jgi:hypothetical protein